MTRARREVVSLDDTPYYHCISRCVRRAFLCGVDRVSGQDYSHRKGWVKDRLGFLCSVFSIRICAYAVMSNHYHVVLCVDRERVEGWSDEEVTRRWGRLFVVPERVARYRRGECKNEALREEVERWTGTARERLYDVSWYMRCLNEWLARKANEEDGCKGRFWEGRFKSQALLDEGALLTCMAYVDLNPIRAGMARTPEQSDDTSIQQRIRQQRACPRRRAEAGPIGLVSCNPKAVHGVPFLLRDYLELVDWSGRAIREGKKGHIPSRLPPILSRLRVEPACWLSHMARCGPRFYHAIGRPDRLRDMAATVGRAWLCGLAASAQMFREARVTV